MNQFTIFGVVTAVLTVATMWLRYKLAQAKQDRLRREEAEQRALDLEKGLKGYYEQSAARETRLVSIAGGLSDVDASKLLSRDIEPPKLSDPADPKDAKGDR